MNIFFELIGEFFLETCFERVSNKRLNIIHRIILLIFLTFIYSVLIILFVSLVFNSDKIFTKILYSVISSLILLFIIKLWCKAYKSK